jgi:hypothetical protein
MRPNFPLRASQVLPAFGALAVTPSVVVGGALMAPATVGTGPAAAAPAPAGDPVLRHEHVSYRSPVVVRGRLASGLAAQGLALQFEPSGTTAWQTVATATTGPGGNYELTARLDRSGAVQVVQLGAPGAATAATAATATAAAIGPPQPVYVGAGVLGRALRHDVLDGHRVTVTGALAPIAASRSVSLQVRRRHGWVTLAHGATGPRGRYRMSFVPRRPASMLLRVRFRGDALNDASGARLQVNVYRPAGASWYDLLGSALACGGTLTAGTVGVANKTLPCGTMVTLHYGHRTVRVPVIDRGPYVAGRDYDLTPATKEALGFGSTGTIWATA